MDDLLSLTNRNELDMRKILSNVDSFKNCRGVGWGWYERKSKKPFIVQLTLLMKKIIKRSWKLCNVNPWRLALASAKIEDSNNAKGK